MFDDAFAALAVPTCRAILVRLTAGDATFGELAQPFRISLSAVPRHLRVLEDVQLIVRGMAKAIELIATLRAQRGFSITGSMASHGGT